MASENETVADIVKWLRNKDYYRGYMGITNPLTDRMIGHILDRIESAHKREIAELKKAYDRAVSADARHAVNNERLKREVVELRECLKEAITKYCTSRPHEYDDGFGNCENFKNGSCASSECWRLECVNKWRKALEGANHES